MNTFPDIDQQEIEVLRMLVHESPMPIGLFVGEEMRIKLANKAMQQAWGMDESVIGQTFHDAVPQLNDQPFEHLLEEVYNTGIAYEATEDRVDLIVDGQLQTFYYNFSYKPLKNPDGTVWGIINTAANVTDLVVARQRAAAAEEERTEALNATEMGTWIFNPFTREFKTDKRFRELFGLLPDEEFTVDVALKTIHQEDLPLVEKHAREITNPQLRKSYDIDCRTIGLHDHRERWVRARGKVHFDEHNVAYRITGTIQDITSQVHIQQKLDEKNRELNREMRKFVFVTDFAPQMIWSATPEGNIDFINQGWVNFTGLSRKSAYNSNWKSIIHPDDFPTVERAWKASLMDGRPYQIEYRMQRYDGVYFWHLERALPLLNDEGEIIKWYGTTTNINEQKELEQQKDEFLGIASHELKTPVTSIKAYAQLLEAMLRKAGDNPKADMVHKMDSQINRLTHLVTDLLDVTKIQSGKLQFNDDYFDFNETVTDLVEDLQRTCATHHINIDLQANGIVFADKDRIGQVITNLITNAIKYSPDAREINVTTRNKCNEVIFAVQDFGIGIPKDKTERVFEQFYRVSGKYQHTFPGLGLGLYISAEIIKREGGRIWVESTEGEGSVFSIALPTQKY